MTSNFVRNALVLGLLAAIGPFAIDMYLPSLPSIGASLDADPDMVLLSLTAFFIPFGLCQIIYGPLSDLYGRKRPMAFGIALFAAASVGCALSDSIEMLLVFRFLQGLGAAAGMSIPRAIVRDLYSGLEEARLMALLMLVFSVSPILAPLTGSFIIDIAGWQSVFWAVTGAALIGLVLLATQVRETKTPDQRVGGFREVLAASRVLLTDRHFMGLSLVGAFGISSFFVYLGNSSFVIIDYYGLSPRLYSVAFAINAISFFAAAQLTGPLAKRFGLRRLVRPAAIGYAIAMSLLLALFLAGVDRLDVMVALLFVGNGFFGLVMPATSVMALERHGAVAGTAASLQGTLQLMTGALVIALSGTFVDGTPMPMVVGIAVCALLSFVFAQLTLGRPANEMAGETAGETAEATAGE